MGGIVAIIVETFVADAAIETVAAAVIEDFVASAVVDTVVADAVGTVVADGIAAGLSDAAIAGAAEAATATASEAVAAGLGIDGAAAAAVDAAAAVTEGAIAPITEAGVAGAADVAAAGEAATATEAGVAGTEAGVAGTEAGAAGTGSITGTEGSLAGTEAGAGTETAAGTAGAETGAVAPGGAAPEGWVETSPGHFELASDVAAQEAAAAETAAQEAAVASGAVEPTPLPGGGTGGVPVEDAVPSWVNPNPTPDPTLAQGLKDYASAVAESLGTTGLLGAGALGGAALTGLVGGAPGGVAGSGSSYLGESPWEWGTSPELVNPGLNPGYIGHAASMPYYQSNNPTDAQYYWGVHAPVNTPEDLATYNQQAGAPATPWGAGKTAVGGQVQFNPSEFVNQYILNPQWGGVNSGTAPGYIAPGPAVPVAH